MENQLIMSDLEYILSRLKGSEQEKFRNSTLLITGCAGFLGYYFTHFFVAYARELGIQSIIGLDNFLLGKPTWLSTLEENNDVFALHHFDLAKDNLNSVVGVEDVTFVIHMASIASPTFYRKYPLETIDANIWGLRRLLDFYKDRFLEGFLYFSSSEVYGDPLPEYIPTSEEYKGNTSTTGPRSCYDEAKRFGETMCYVYSKICHFPITIVRPFNNYGPGMKLTDQRVPADFARAVLENKDMKILSDGTPTRTFCYVSDAIVGYLKAIVYGKFDIFNIGLDKPEISIKKLAQVYLEKGQEIFNYSGRIKFDIPFDQEYLVHNPSRRCPNINKARTLLAYEPMIQLPEGVSRFLLFLKESGARL